MTLLNHALAGGVEVSSSPTMPGEFPVSGGSPDPAISSNLSLTQALHARRAEYTAPRSIKIKVGTWNVASFKDTDQDIGNWFVQGKGVSETVNSTKAKDGPISSEESFGHQEARFKPKNPTASPDDPGNVIKGEDIDIYVLGLQEIVDINSAVEAFRQYSYNSTSKTFRTSLEHAIPAGYKLIVEQQLVGLLLFIFVSPAIAPHIHSVSVTSTGTGLMGYMGNKGAVAARIVLGETTRLVFVNCHLSSGFGKTELDRRNWDAATILNRIRFEPITETFGFDENKGERIGDEDFAFWFGDLNYRLEGVPGDDVRRILHMHSQMEYDKTASSEQTERYSSELSDTRSSLSSVRLSDDSEATSSDIGSTFSSYSVQNEDYPDHDLAETDPTSLQAAINSLLPHDELRQQQKANKAFHQGWREGSIHFLPTYKYDIGSVATFDSGEKKRGPSWCDRILYRTKKDRLRSEERAKLEQEAKERDRQMSAQGITRAAEAENTIFEYDPDTDGDDEYEDRSVHSDPPSDSGFQSSEDDTVKLESYTSHQKVSSSDHKPLDSVFTLTYDAVDDELKSRIQNEIARELDRAENEGRPVLTMVVEGGSQEDDSTFDGVNFGDVRYDEPKTCFVTIANTGSVVAYFGFIDQPKQADGSTPIPTWLSINFNMSPDVNGTHLNETSPTNDNDSDSWAAGISKVSRLKPGESTTVDLMCHVKDKRLLKSLNDGDKLDDVLILRVKNGRDYFLAVKGSWRSSVQGRTIDHLIRIPEGGVRALQAGNPFKKSDQSDYASQAVVWSAPREIFRLTESIESLTERITAEWSMLGNSLDENARPPMTSYAGWPFVEESWTLDRETRQRLRVDVNEALDTDRSFDSILSSRLPPLHRLEVFADALLDFLANLEDGIIPVSLWEKLEAEHFSKEKIKNKMSIDEKRASILEILSSSSGHNISFILLANMLARISQDVVSIVQGSGKDTQASPELPESPKFKMKRKSLSRDLTTATRLLIQKNFAAVFGDILVRTSDDSGSGKTWNASQAHRQELIETFLESS